MTLISMDLCYISLVSDSSMEALIWSLRISSDGFFVTVRDVPLPRSVEVIAKVVQ